MICRYRHRMWCNCKKPAKPFPPVPVESVGIVGWDDSGTQTFQAQNNPYYASFDIEVIPANATNKMVTITSSNTRVINWAVYDSTAVTFTIEGEGDAEVTITSQDNPEVSTTYSVTVTPAQEPFSPNNSILVIPGGKASNTNAIAKFFAVDSQSTDYVQARFGTNNKLTYVSYYGACDGDANCEGMFNNEDIKAELGAKVGDYIAENGIPADGKLYFTDEMYAVIEDYFAGEASISDVVTEIEQGGDIVEPTDPCLDPCGPDCPDRDPCECYGDCSCPVYISEVDTEPVDVVAGDTYVRTFIATHDCETLDYSAWSVSSSNDNIATAQLDTSESKVVITTVEGAESNSCTITLSDGEASYVLEVNLIEESGGLITFYVPWYDSDYSTSGRYEYKDEAYVDAYINNGSSEPIRLGSDAGDVVFTVDGVDLEEDYSMLIARDDDENEYTLGVSYEYINEEGETVPTLKIDFTDVFQFPESINILRVEGGEEGEESETHLGTLYISPSGDIPSFMFYVEEDAGDGSMYSYREDSATVYREGEFDSYNIPPIDNVHLVTSYGMTSEEIEELIQSVWVRVDDEEGNEISGVNCEVVPVEDGDGAITEYEINISIDEGTSIDGIYPTIYMYYTTHDEMEDIDTDHDLGTIWLIPADETDDGSGDGEDL